MKVYRLINDSKAMNLRGIEDSVRYVHPIGSDFNGEPKQNVWSPVKIETLYKKKYSDFPYFRYGVPVFLIRVKEIIAPFISNEVEFLPLIHEELELYIVNVTNVLDCVDFERSEARRNSNGKIIAFNKVVFDCNRIPSNTYMFKIKEHANTHVYVTDLFKDLIERHKLKGLDFSIVHDSEFTAEKEQEQQRNYEAALAAIESGKGEECSYEEARERVDQGRAMASGKWKMQLDSKGRFTLGELLLDLTYQWILPVYIPPILLGYAWHEVEKSEI